MADNSKRTGAALEAHYQFLTWLVQAIERFPKSHKFTLGDRIVITALDVLEALIDATYTKERTQHLRRANLGIEKLRFLLRLAADLRLLEAWTAPCRRVVRGGSWNNNPQNLRSAKRNRNTTDNRNNNLGFRVGRTLSARAGTITVVPGAH